jgi:hypothetical protein
MPSSQLSFKQFSNDDYSSFNFTLGETGGLKGSAVKAPSKPAARPSLTACNEGGNRERASRICLTLGNPIEGEDDVSPETTNRGAKTITLERLFGFL